MALILTGVAPSFADENNSGGGGKNAVVPSASVDWSDAPTIDGTSGIIMDAGSGMILYEKNARERRDPASMTKILTALVVLETADLDQEITVTEDADDTGVNIDLKEGEVLTVEQLLYAMMLYSANDAADALAIGVGGTVEGFCKMMNERAARCGTTDTEFANASGLNTYGDAAHLTTAYDIAVITREAMKNETFRKIVATEKYEIPATNMSKARKIKSINYCLVEDEKTVTVNGVERPYKYEGTTGVKTGYTEIAGQCFCGTAKRGDTELIAVTMNSTSREMRFADVMTLWDYGFSKYYTYTATEGRRTLEEFRVWQGEKGKVAVGISEDMDITLNKGADSSGITVESSKNDGMIKAPLKKGDVLGTLTAYNEDGEVIAVSDLVALENVEKGGILSYIGIADENILPFILWLLSIAVLIIVIRMLIVRSRRKKKKRKKARRERNMRRREWEKEKNPFDR